MGIYIKGIEMPKDKAIAVVIHPDGTAYSAEMSAGVCTEYLKDCVAIPVSPQWIPVTERLPEQNGKYLAFALKEENTMDFCDGHWMLYGIDYRRYVTHWMPFPAPPAVDTDKQP